VIRERRGWVPARVNLGIALAGSGDLARAEEQFRAAADLAPDDPEIPYNLGVALAIGGRRRAAEEAFREALALAPGDPSITAALRELRSIER